MNPTLRSRPHELVWVSYCYTSSFEPIPIFADMGTASLWTFNPRAPGKVIEWKEGVTCPVVTRP